MPRAARGGWARVVGGPGDNDEGQEWEFLRAVVGRVQEASRLLERARTDTPYQDAGRPFLHRTHPP